MQYAELSLSCLKKNCYFHSTHLLSCPTIFSCDNLGTYAFSEYDAKVAWNPLMYWMGRFSEPLPYRIY